jgi:hypothetical protein
LPGVDPKELKEGEDFRLIGKSVPRRDTPSKVNGTAQYAIDVKLPGMVYASSLRSMTYFAGLDVSVKETSVCIVDDAGKILIQCCGSPSSWISAAVA